MVGKGTTVFSPLLPTDYGPRTADSFFPNFIALLAFTRDNVSHDIDVQGRTADLNLPHL